MRYIILRVYREAQKTPDFDGVAIKFFPFKQGNTFATIDAETPEQALRLAKIPRPNLAHFLAVQPLDTYNATIARIAPKRILSPPANSGA